MFSKRLTLIAAAAASAAAFAVPSAAQASPCVVHLPGPGDTWDTAADGSLANGLNNNGATFDAGHGGLKVNGVAYPAVVNSTCASTDTAVSFPARSVGGMTVSRALSVVGNRIRWVDTIYNPAANQVDVDVDYRFSVTGSQISENSEVGSGFEVTKDDHWATLRNSGSSKPFLQWGRKGDNAIDPAMLSEHPDTPLIWQNHAGSMPDATLKYVDVVVPPKGTIRLLHVGGSAANAPEAIAAAKDRAAPFSGFTKATAQTIINWGNDPDADGVAKFNDDCPSVKGNLPNGCTAQVQPPLQDPNPQPPVDPQDPNNPQPPVDPQNPGNPSNPNNPGNGGGETLSDKTAPTIKVTKLATKVKKSKAGKLAPKIACNEACRITVKVQVTKKGKKKASTVLSTKSTPLSSSARTIKLKVKQSSIKKLKKQRITLRITAKDASGNTRTIAKTVTLKR